MTNVHIQKNRETGQVGGAEFVKKKRIFPETVAKIH